MAYKNFKISVWSNFTDGVNSFSTCLDVLTIKARSESEAKRKAHQKYPIDHRTEGKKTTWHSARLESAL